MIYSAHILISAYFWKEEFIGEKCSKAKIILMADE